MSVVGNGENEDLSLCLIKLFSDRLKHGRGLLKPQNLPYCSFATPLQRFRQMKKRQCLVTHNLWYWVQDNLFSPRSYDGIYISTEQNSSTTRYISISPDSIRR